MTEQIERPEADTPVIGDALDVIDEALGKMMRRELISSGEVADVLLDVRTALTSPRADDVAEVADLEREPSTPAPA